MLLPHPDLLCLPGPESHYSHHGKTTMISLNIPVMFQQALY